MKMNDQLLDRQFDELKRALSEGTDMWMVKEKNKTKPGYYIRIDVNRR